MLLNLFNGFLVSCIAREIEIGSGFIVHVTSFINLT